MKNSLYTIAKRMVTHELITGSFFVFLGSMANNFFSFLFNLFLVRNFSTSDYGIYASLISLVFLLSFFSQSLIVVIVKFAGDYLAKGKINEASLLYKRLLFSMLIIGAVGCLALTMLLPIIMNFLHITSSIYLILSIMLVFVAYVAITNDSYLRSALKFKFLAFTAGFGSFLKLTSGILLITSGFGIAGALSAVLLNSLFPFVLAFIPLLFLWKEKTRGQSLPVKQMIGYAIPASIAVLASTSFLNADILLVKHFFSPHQAGLYGGLSLIGKVIFYFTFPIPVVMFPLLVKRYNNGEPIHKLFYLSVLLIALPSIFVTLIYFAVPDLMISLFLGSKEYTVIAPLLGLFGIFISLFCLASIFVSFFLSIERPGIYKIVVPASLLQVILIYFFHNDFRQVIFSSIVSLSLLLFALLLYYYRNLYGVYHAKK